jgi:CheY-like chemotaxis protein
MKMLVLDDEATIGRAIQRRIRRDHVVHCETDPERAIEWVGAVAGTDARFDVVLCDYNMPKMTGLDVAEALRTLVEPPAFVLMTGIQCLDAVAELVDAVLAKPFDSAQLESALADFAERSARRRRRPSTLKPAA